MIITVDRIEGKFAVCETEDRKTVNIPILILDKPKEGDCYSVTKCDNPFKEKINKLMGEVFK